ncbi:MAG TPA: hypothetical protein VL547_20810 [Dinghuibacter sp.]|uniref:hypothetical protein n=1 Tax=Dinghuibacter sp. TaxID=2024697 RepID=UPI002BF5B945|nr:hypothetical protein [Dinghuibacter sp.]HTJ14498.1 hypothetical protein [Dinghuibacter sp.]
MEVRILTVGFWMIVVALLLRVTLLAGTFLFPFFDLTRLGWVVVSWMVFAYTAVIGYVAWLFREQQWIVVCSFLYILTRAFDLLVLGGVPHDTLRFALLAIVGDVPCIVSGIAWMRVSRQPIAPYFWTLGGLYVGWLVLLAGNRVLFVATHAIQLAFVDVGVSLLIPVPTLFLIARARRWVREERALEEEVSKLS